MRWSPAISVLAAAALAAGQGAAHAQAASPIAKSSPVYLVLGWKDSQPTLKCDTGYHVRAAGNGKPDVGLRKSSPLLVVTFTWANPNGDGIYAGFTAKAANLSLANNTYQVFYTCLPGPPQDREEPSL
jgi:hypothetical protein